MDFDRALGLTEDGKHRPVEPKQLHLLINFKLAALGQPVCDTGSGEKCLTAAGDILSVIREKNRLLSGYHGPADHRIQDFLHRYLGDLELDRVPMLPSATFALDRHGVARELSLPFDGDRYESPILSSYRVAQGVLHNPSRDRRTTEGSFHIAEGGLPIPGDKKAVPKRVFARLLEEAVRPPAALMELPFTSHQAEPARLFVSLLLRPLVCPEIPGQEPEKTMEIRLFAPGSLVSNLDFVESIFGNAGNPYLAENDAALDPEHWTGHTGCVLLAPHLIELTKKRLGLPHRSEASPRQVQDGMCWEREEELYNNGNPFKVTARDEQGVIFTILADNYYGYCKKEVKTQISYSANLFGLAEEEHAGGALTFVRRSHGEEYGVDSETREEGYNFFKMLEKYGDIMTLQPEGHAVDDEYPDLIYVPQDLRMDLNAQTINWTRNGRPHSIRLQPGKIYMQPNGYKVEMVKHPNAGSWSLVGTNPEGVLCHKPSTVSGGGKSEISKALSDMLIYGPLFVNDLDADMERVAEIFHRDYTTRFLPGHEHEDRDPTRQPLHMDRSLGSMVRLLTPSASYTEEFNTWLAAIPPRILALAFLIKRFYRPEWGDQWREHISVDIMDGAPGHELRLDGRRITATYLRVGFDDEGNWRTFKLRQDFIASEKIQMEDDITASVVVPEDCSTRSAVSEHERFSEKLVKNCEYRFFQRPDEAIHPGFDKQAEADIAGPGGFLANFEPLEGEKLASVVEDVLTLDRFTAPMRKRLELAYERDRGYVVSSAHPRIVDGRPSKNPRYLQIRPDLTRPLRRHAAEISTRFHRGLGMDEPLCHPVDAVLMGRRNNPPEPGIRPLAVYNPIHYQELPELFMEMICSLTGRSPSTTGAGSEGALTKGPFNALLPTADLNNALVSYILTGHAGFSSSAGYIGPRVRVDHDISLLVPEIWSRLKPRERRPEYLIAHRYFEPMQDFEHNGQKVLASRLGYRMTDRFVHAFLGKIFDNPTAVFTEEIMRPETQDLAVFVDGINNIVEAQQRVARRYIEDGSIHEACPPLQALLYIMAEGSHQGMDAHDQRIRYLFTREALLKSDWYRERLEVKQERDVRLWRRHIHSLQQFRDNPAYADEIARLGIAEKLEAARRKLQEVEAPEYLHRLKGTLGADPLGPPRSAG